VGSGDWWTWQFKLGYMKTVSNVEIRTKLRMAEVPHAFSREPKCAWLALTEQERQAKIEASEARRRHLATHMRKDQLFMERKLMANMHRKLHFLPNPRFAKEPPVGLRDKHVPSKQNLTSAKHVSFLVTPPEILFSEYAVGGIFQAELQLQNLNMNTRRLRVLPPTTKFFSISSLSFPGRDGYVAPGMIAKCVRRPKPKPKLSLVASTRRTSSSVSVSVSVSSPSLPPLSSVYSIQPHCVNHRQRQSACAYTCVKTPLHCGSSAVGGGGLQPLRPLPCALGELYSVLGFFFRIWIRFQPEALGDYEDVLTVHSDLDKFEVPILAARRPPALTLPEVLDCGPVLCGNSRVVEFTCTNLGGHGRFRCVSLSSSPLFSRLSLLIIQYDVS